MHSTSTAKVNSLLYWCAAFRRTSYTVVSITNRGALKKADEDLRKCQVSCDSISQRVWRLAAARDVMNQLYQLVDLEQTRSRPFQVAGNPTDACGLHSIRRIAVAPPKARPTRAKTRT